MTTADHGTVAVPRRTATEVLARARTMVDPALRAAIGRLPDELRLIAGYHFGWLDERGRPTTAAAGKAVRPALVLLCAEAVGGGAGGALPAAVAVELVHNFSLLHDDVMDRDRLRRHRPSVWSIFGTANAILVGDALHSLAFEELARGGDDGTGAHRLSGALLRLARGQCADVGFERRMDVGPVECLNMARDKTGALLAVACALGAWYGGGGAERIDGLWRFGMHLGLAFQLADDLLGIWGDPRIIGKPAGADLRRRKKTLPVVAALAQRHPAARRLAALYGGDGPLDDGAVAAAARLVEEAGGRAWARRRLARELAAAGRSLAACRPGAAPAAALLALTDLVARRGH
ncbi:MAG TPA: polyprenyl synthetase family protein [Streptosporangiaceae bacterium]|nr:polyprenyl synthetase family protein [Streptosporangiaceae bacterium]